MLLSATHRTALVISWCDFIFKIFFKICQVYHTLCMTVTKIFLSGSVGEKFPGQTGSLEFFTALPDKIFCLGLSSHSWPSGKFVYARYARYTNSNALLQLHFSSVNVFCPH